MLVILGIRRYGGTAALSYLRCEGLLSVVTWSGALNLRHLVAANTITREKLLFKSHASSR